LTYDWVDLDACTFSGRVEVTFDPIPASEADVHKVVKLNAVDLTVRDARVVVLAESAAASEMRATRWIVDQHDQSVTIEFPRAIPTECSTKLVVDFSGYLNEKLAGFYKSTVKPGHVMGVTQFE